MEKNKFDDRMNLMKITVRVYGRYKDITGKDRVQLDVTDGNTLQDVINSFIKQYPIVQKDKGRMMAIKNKMFASFDTIVSEEDEISLSPPVVSGG